MYAALQSSLLQLHAKRRLTGLVVGVPKESLDGELRVALAPESVKKLKKAGVAVKIQVPCRCVPRLPQPTPFFTLVFGRCVV
jgi:hypothetical protein